MTFEHKRAPNHLLYFEAEAVGGRRSSHPGSSTPPHLGNGVPVEMPQHA